MSAEEVEAVVKGAVKEAVTVALDEQFRPRRGRKLRDKARYRSRVFGVGRAGTAVILRYSDASYSSQFASVGCISLAFI